MSALFIIFLLVVVITFLFASWLQGLPSVENAEDYTQSQTTTVYASDETTVLAQFYLQNRQPVPLDEISPNVIEATLATEDERFYEHSGIDLFGIIRAVVNNFSEGTGIQGASTISQQFVRNTMLADEAQDITIKRKLREAWLSLNLEEAYSKDQILNMYLNTINYGDNCYGIEAAAHHYFSKSAADLTLLEAATLVGIPQSPTAFTPTVHPEECQQRRNIVLERMEEVGDISQEEYEQLITEPLVLEVEPDDSINGVERYPYFTTYVRELLLDQFSVADVYEGNLTVYTTLDITRQEEAEEACAQQYASLPDDAEVALVAVNPDNGKIEAMVGGRDFNENQFNLVTQAQRQAGSSFKTFTLTTAIEQGIDPLTNIDCTSPTQIADWSVENIDNTDYGIRSIQSATAVSSNTGFAHLITEVGAQNVADVAHRLGIDSYLEPVGSLTLGSSGVTPLEMAEAYATFASGGIHHDAIAINRVLNRYDEVIYEPSTEGERVLSPEVAYAVTRVLETVFTEGTASAAQLPNGQPAAGKTGTSESYRDHWLCGFTPQLSTTVWIGARNERSIPSIDCCYVWRSFMSMALANSPIENFPTAADPPYNNAWNQSQQSQYGYNSKGWSSSSSSESESRSRSSSSSEDPSSSSSSPSHVEPTPAPVPEPSVPNTPVTPEPEPSVPNTPVTPPEPVVPDTPVPDTPIE